MNEFFSSINFKFKLIFKTIDITFLRKVGLEIGNVSNRVIYEKVRKGKNYINIPTFPVNEQGKARVGKVKVMLHT